MSGWKLVVLGEKRWEALLPSTSLGQVNSSLGHTQECGNQNPPNQRCIDTRRASNSYHYERRRRHLVQFVYVLQELLDDHSKSKKVEGILLGDELYLAMVQWCSTRTAEQVQNGRMNLLCSARTDTGSVSVLQRPIQEASNFCTKVEFFLLTLRSLQDWRQNTIGGDSRTHLFQDTIEQNHTVHSFRLHWQK